MLTYLELYGDARIRAIVFSDDSPCHLRDGIFTADQALAAIDAFEGSDAVAFSKGFSDQFLTDDAEESAKEAFYHEGIKLPRPYMAKLFRWAAFGDWWDAFSHVKVPAMVIGGRVSKVPLRIAAKMHEAIPGSSFVVFEADEGGGHAMFWEDEVFVRHLEYLEARLTTDALVDLIRESVIGNDLMLEGPYGARRVVYADYTASGRSLTFIERAIQTMVLPWYANTHSESSGTGRQTGKFREGARRAVLEGIGGDDSTAVIFVGSGATGAVNRLVAILGLTLPKALDDRYWLKDHILESDRPVVFIGPHEHHSNDLPWRESIADVVRVPEDCEGHVDLDVLRTMLIDYSERPLKIGSFSAASNVTGILTDTDAVTSLLHEHGALSFWDYAAAAPYVEIEMVSRDNPLAYKDGLFISPHKFVGGPGSPGVLAIRRELLLGVVPVAPGGGTVSFVSEDDRIYSDDPVQREESGTPDIIGSIRAGLAFTLKADIGVGEIERREKFLVRSAIDRLSTHAGLLILGSVEAKRLSIISFRVRSGKQFLHHNFVVALLNDLFGIQVRGGCSCAGPYGLQLLHINRQQALSYEDVVCQGWEGLKPGWIRLNFNYFLDEEEFDYLLDAVVFIADFGERFLLDYSFNPLSGQWVYRRAEHPEVLKFDDLAVWRPDREAVEDLSGSTFAEQLRLAHSLADARADALNELEGPSGIPIALDWLRDFVLPSRCVIDTPPSNEEQSLVPKVPLTTTESCA